ncbi:MAG TPA: tRNA pseudouridine(38-40) synthase TruA [Chloroflexia bacterium]|nr:tRNA pseudouridine(38-40) synthase TruA [Chloroflexia bacterium]
MRNIKLVLEYDGTDFSGSQLQANGRTVQGELEKALASLTGLPAGERCKVSLAGRTDTGVHASGQVANFKTASAHSLETFRRGLNALLPFDIAVLSVEEVDEEFHARFSARERYYRYRILNRPARSPLLRRYALQVAQPLKLEAMQAAANRLVGEHDFASFAGAGWGIPAGEGAETEENDGPSTVRKVLKATWSREMPDPAQTVLVLEIAANAFLPHMVRNIVGTLLQVGKGEISPDDFEEIIAACDRRRAGPTAPACGLSLVEVRY